MGLPLLPTDHAWHRQRASLRAPHSRLRPPPLVAAGLELEPDPAHGPPTIKLGGLAVIFGHFPAGFDELIALAKDRLHLGDEQARQLDGVLATRVMALWAWLAGEHRDLYLEYDRATDDLRCWLIGPGPDDLETVDPEAANPALDQAFHDGLILGGSGNWGGAPGLERLIRRHGRTSLAVAAQVAVHLDHHPENAVGTLALAHSRWPSLDAGDEVTWAGLVDDELPFTCSQLGRLALRLGLLRAARALLAAGAVSLEAGPLAWFDHGQVCEALGDLADAETAFNRFTAHRPDDPDGWRRLLLIRLRRGRTLLAGDTFERYLGSGGTEADLAGRLAGLSWRMPVEQRATLAGWLLPRLRMARHVQDQTTDPALAVFDGPQGGDPRLPAALTALRSACRQALPDTIGPALPRELDDLVLLILPLAVPPFPGDTPERITEALRAGISLWCSAPAVRLLLTDLDRDPWPGDDVITQLIAIAMPTDSPAAS